MNKNILSLAIPNIITNITVPLLGMVDLAIVGRLGSEQYIGAIAIGTMIFNLMYWNFGFLRMGTSGFTAQAYGANNQKEISRILMRACSVALGAAVLLIILQKPIAWLSFKIIDGSDAMEQLAYQYFSIRIWAAPATLGLYSLKGWFIGMQNSKLPMYIAIVINVLNIFFSLFFVIVWKMEIAGVAWGTVCAQYSGLVTAIFFLLFYYRGFCRDICWKEVFDGKEIVRFFKINSDIFLRTLGLIIVFTFIPVEGAKMNDMILAINTLLMQFFTLFSYIMDGFAYAGESLVGRFIGAKDGKSLRLSIKLLFRWGLILSIAFVCIYALFGKYLLLLFTDNQNIIMAAKPYYYWVLIVPIVGFGAFLYDGIYIGATASKEMRNAMFVALILFFGVYYSLCNTLQNNALWIAFIVFLFTRGFMQFLFSKKAIYRHCYDNDVMNQ